MADPKDGLFLQKRDVVSLDEARAEAEEQRRRPGDKLNDYVTRGWAKETFGKLAVELGAKMYEQVSEEIAEYLEEQERRHLLFIRREIEARSFMGRLRTLTRNILYALGAESKPALVPRVVDPVEALDPGVAARAMEVIGESEAVHVHAP
jgi:hypothetical protein